MRLTKELSGSFVVYIPYSGLIQYHNTLKTLIDKRNLGRIRKIRHKHIQWRKLISQN